MNPTTEYAPMREQRWTVRPKDCKVKLHLQVNDCGGVAVVRCHGRITYRNEASLLSTTVSDLLPRTRCLVLDLSGVEKIDSAGLGELVVLYMRTQASQCVFKLAPPRREI